MSCVALNATVAQLVEQLTRNEQVACSNQVSSSKKIPEPGFRDFSFCRSAAKHVLLLNHLL